MSSLYTILLKQETPTNTNATDTFASFWHVCETLIAALSCSLWDCFWVVKVATATNATNETRQHGIAWNQTSLGLTNKHFQPKPDLSRNKTPRWTSANQPQNSQSIRKALQKKNAKPAPLERFPHETQWCDSLWFQLFWADLTTTKTRFRSPLLKWYVLKIVTKNLLWWICSEKSENLEVRDNGDCSGLVGVPEAFIFIWLTRSYFLFWIYFSFGRDPMLWMSFVCFCAVFLSITDEFGRDRFDSVSSSPCEWVHGTMQTP